MRGASVPFDRAGVILLNAQASLVMHPQKHHRSAVSKLGEPLIPVRSSRIITIHVGSHQVPVTQIPHGRLMSLVGGQVHPAQPAFHVALASFDSSPLELVLWASDFRSFPAPDAALRLEFPVTGVDRPQFPCGLYMALIDCSSQAADYTGTACRIGAAIETSFIFSEAGLVQTFCFLRRLRSTNFPANLRVRLWLRNCPLREPG